MKIGITCYPTYGGSGVVATELGKELARRGHDVHFICYSIPRRLGKFEGNISFHEVDVMPYPLFQYPPYCLALASKMWEVARFEGLDLFHVHYAIPHASSALMAKDMMGSDGLKVITTLHGTDITLVGNDHSFLPVTRYSIERSDGVTVVSNFLREQTRLELGIERDIELIYNFIDTERFKRVSNPTERDRFAPGGEKILIHISNFRPVKRITDVVEIFRRVRQKIPSRLILVGDGPERSSAEARCRELEFCQEVHFLGKQEPIASLLSISDLFLFPSELESFGLAALEAMSCRVPVVGANAGGLPEVVAHGESGYLAPVGDVERMAQYAIDLLADDDKRVTMGRRARDRAVEEFGVERIVPQYERYYEKVMGGGKNG